MKKKMKRLASDCLVLALILVLLPVRTWATAMTDEEMQQQQVTTIIREVPIMPEGMEDYLIGGGEDTTGAKGVEWYQDNRQILINHDLYLMDMVRRLGWFFVLLLCPLVNAAELIYDKTFGLIDVTQSEAVNELLATWRPVLAALVVLCLIGMGILLMVKRQKVPIVRNLLLGILAVAGSLWLFTTANALIAEVKDAVLSPATTQAYEIVNGNIIDLINLDKRGDIEAVSFKDNRGIYYGAGISSNDGLSWVDVTEVLDWHTFKNGKDRYNWSSDFNNRMKWRAIHLGDKWLMVENAAGITSLNIGNTLYYRYYIDYISCLLQLLALAMLFVVLAYKNVKITYELVVSRILAFFYAADVSNGERLKNILFFIRDAYITLCISMLSVKLFEIMTNYIYTLGFITGLGRGLVSIMVACVCTSTPAIVQKLLGVEGGGRSPLGTLITTAALLFGRQALMRGGRGGKMPHPGPGAGGSWGGASGSPGGAGGSWGGAPGSSGGAWGGAGGTSSDGGLPEPDGSTSASGGGFDTSFMGGGAGANDAPSSAGAAEGSGGPDTSFMGGSGAGGKDAAPYSGADQRQEPQREDGFVPDFMGGSAGANNAAQPSFTQPEPPKEPEKRRVVNPVFREAVQRLTPDASASEMERKDFNRQMNAIVRGRKHQPIPLTENATDYQKKNYEKALELEKAYRAYKPPKEPPKEKGANK